MRVTDAIEDWFEDAPDAVRARRTLERADGQRAEPTP
jgi:hypothetical protein